MKNKGTLIFFAISLAVVSLFHLSFTLKTYLVEQKADRIAKGDKEVAAQYLDSIAHKDVYNILLRKYTYAECKERELNLGLDLQGGMHVILEVALEDLVRELSGNNQEKTFQKAIALTKEKQKNSQKDFISLFDESLNEIDPQGDISGYFATLENKDEIQLGASREKVVDFLRKKSESALGSTFEVLRKRIDKFGVTQPNIQLLEGTERIMVELPGIDDPERVRKLLQGSAKLEFWETYENKEILPYFDAVNKALEARNSLDGKTVTEDSTIKKDEKKDFFKKPAVITEPKIAATQKDTNSLLGKEKKDSIGKDSTDNSKLSEAEFNKKFPLYKYLAPAVNRTDKGVFHIQGPIVGSSFYFDTAKVNLLLTYPEVKAALPPDVFFAWTARPVDDNESVYQLIALKITTLDKKAPLDGKIITNARVDISPNGEREVSISMNSEGARKWEKLTEANAPRGSQPGRSIAILLDGLVRSFPTVQTKISGGNSQITGGFSQEEASDLSNILNSGKLEVGVNIIEEAIVGPSLGRESINNGLLSILIGFISVVLFMLWYYNRAGWVANLALFANVFFIMGVLASLGAALTLPGIAGIVLTVGMAVDANVLIYERIREELRHGKGVRPAIRDGYQLAYSSIIDSNLTTLITGVILLIFGTGPVYGFAVTLCIGILTSMFTAILISRVIFEFQLTKERAIKFGNNITENLFKKFNFNYIGNRKYGYMVSGVLILIGIVSLTTKGLDFGVDFKGGYSYVIRFEQDVKTVEIVNSFKKQLEISPEVKTFGSNNQIQLTTDYMIEDNTGNGIEKVEADVAKVLSGFTDNKFEILSRTKVGPTIADDMKKNSLFAIFYSLIGIFVYIFFRFRNWQYGLAGIICLFHDTFIILGVFSLFKGILPFSLSIDQAIIAAILTNIGYDINDTVVIYDRMREKLAISKKKDIGATINDALNETLSRTIVTSVTVILVLLILFIFGGAVIRGFSFALLVGTLVGSVSSLFVAAPLVYEFSRKSFAKTHTKE